MCVEGVELVVGPIDSMVAPNGAAVVVLVVVTGIAVEEAIANGFEVAAPRCFEEVEIWAIPRHFEEDAVVAAPKCFEEVGIWAIPKHFEVAILLVVPMDSKLVAV